MSIKRTIPTKDEYLKENQGLAAVLRYSDIPCDR